MPNTLTFRGVVATSILASALTVAALWLLHSVVVSPKPAWAQQAVDPDVVLYAGPRESSSDESFIFHNSKTGDIWVYKDHKLKNHYRLRTLGEDLEKVD